MRPFIHTTIAFLAVSVLYLLMIFIKGFDGWPLAILIFIYISLLVLGAINVRWDFYIRSFHRGKNKQGISLTFDDGPAAETAAILDILKEQNVPAAFFTIGKNACEYPHLVKRWDAEGHLIGNHSYDHGFHFDWQTAAKMKAEIEAANQLIHTLTGKKMKFFRPPYGVTNPNLAKAVKQSGMYSIGWSVRSFDTAANDADKLLARILQKTKGGDIILLHDSMAITKNILTELIIKLRQKGYSFVRLDELLDIKPYE